MIRVIAAVVESDGRVLLGRRPAHKRHGGLWEFPGGKMLPGEGDEDAARRELDEELGLEVTGIGARLLTVADPGSAFVIEFVEVRVRGVPTPTEHDEIGWFQPAELRGLALAPADRRFADLLAERPRDGL